MPAGSAPACCTSSTLRIGSRNSPEEYVSLVLSVAAQPPERRILREWVAASTLTDAAAFTEQFENALRGIWRERCAQDSDKQ